MLRDLRRISDESSTESERVTLAGRVAFIATCTAAAVLTATTLSSTSSKRVETNPTNSSDNQRLIALPSDAGSEESQRLKSIGFKRSSSQPDTKRDGNCGVYCLLDQLMKVNHPLIESISSHQELRALLVSKLPEMLMNGHLFWTDLGTPKSWMENMANNGVWVDEIFLCIAANFFNKNIVIIPMDPNSAHHAKLYSLLDSFHGGSGEPLFMLYYEEWRGCGHYQSIEVDPNSTPNRVLQHFN